ncbi:hypothetical protein NN561_020216 [Cricetulus griseus]
MEKENSGIRLPAMLFVYQFFQKRRDDLIRAIKKLKALGTGFGIIPVGGTYLIQSVPAELNMDHTVVLQLAEVGCALEC